MAFKFPKFRAKYRRVVPKTAPSVIIPFLQPTGQQTTVTTAPLLDSRDVIVADSAGFAVDMLIGIFSGMGYSFFGKLAAINGNTLTMNIPFDGFPTESKYPAGSAVLAFTDNLNVNGTPGAPRTFTLQAGLNLNIDIHRFMLTFICEDPVDYNGFASGDALENGLLLRKVNAETSNVITLYNNWDLARLSYDVTVFEQVKQQDVNGLAMRFSVDKLGTVSRLSAGDKFEMLVQDDLTLLGNRKIIELKISAQGSIVG